MYSKGTVKRMMKNHIGQLQRAAGGKGTGSKYEYILSQNELMNAYMQSRKDLNYALKKQSKRDRYLVANAAGMQEKINEICYNAVEAASKELAAMLEQDAANAIQNALSSISGAGTAATAARSANTGVLLGRTLANGLMKGLGSVFDDMIGSDDY